MAHAHFDPVVLACLHAKVSRSVVDFFSCYSRSFFQSIFSKMQWLFVSFVGSLLFSRCPSIQA